MITQLTIKNVALISELSIAFESGFNVLSGETGAGKSIIVDSVNLILGSRADKDLIRAGQQSAYVEAQIDLPDTKGVQDVLAQYGIEGNDLVVSRELSVSGRNICRINGRLINVAMLREIMANFVDIYGQNQNMNLLDQAYHLDLIDAYAGQGMVAVKASAAQIFAEYSSVKNELDALRKNASDKIRMIDLLRYQIDEIERANLKTGEEEELQAERRRMQNAEKIAGNLNSAKAALSGDHGAVGKLYDAATALRQISGIDTVYDKLEKILLDAYYAVEDASYELNDLADNVVYDENRLNEIETRLIEISSLKRKYGPSVEHILEFLETSRQQLDQLENSEIRMEKLEQAEEQCRTEMEMCFGKLSALRKEYAVSLEQRLKSELADLGMKDAQLYTEFTQTGYSENGWDAAALLISVNRGTPPRKLIKVASGGEISRIMLAIKNIVAENEEIDTMIFDEIDTGISGTMAQIVARKIANISRERQVICVTHLPQIAAMGDANFYIEKGEQNDIVTTSVHRISGKVLAGEIARLSGGLQSQAAHAHAAELLENASKVKANMN